MKILHVVENADERHGGVAVAMPFLCKYLKKIGVTVSINSVRRYSEETNRIIAGSAMEWNIHENSISDTMRYSATLKDGLYTQIVPSETIIHTNNQWNYPIYCADKVARRNGVPLVCSIHGSLSPWALKQKKIIKKTFWHLFQRRIFQSAACLHVTDMTELNAVRDLGLQSPAAVIPNGIEIEEFADLPEKGEAKAFFQLNEERKHILFLSRIYPLKGLKYLVDAWCSVAAKFNDWDLLVCGPTYDESYLSQIKKEVSDRGLDSRVKMTGMLNHEDRLVAYAAADLFVLPSHTENFGLVIAEAMAAKLPVIATHGAPWKEVEEHGCGWWVELTQENISKALLEALGSAEASLMQKGEAGYKLISENYAWTEQARKMKSVYEWLLGLGERPEYVHL